MTDHDTRTNRLIGETSPYLLQHARNPVDWYPWGEEAFARARAEDKPIFLSIGYSTCHWCHVMERESFENEEIARLFNDYVVAVKVDREERPDIDQLYMTFLQAMTGQGGWPMNLFLTPERKPFYGATYIPPEPRSGLPGIREVLTAIHKLWQGDRSRLLDYSETLVGRIKELDRELTEGKGSRPAPELIGELKEHYARYHDPLHGGFSDKPKFPQPHVLIFLLNQAALGQDDKAQGMAEKTLEEIYRGGIHDHLGGGFSRYSVDERWLVPHFEKMLYDNAGLLEAYTLAFAHTGKELYRIAAMDIISYLKERMTDPSGAFHAAEDADSEGEEGKFYAFSMAEVTEILEDGSSQFMAAYGITEAGNFEGRNVLNLLDTREEAPEEIFRKFREERRRLKAARDERVPPHRDDKILASWNGRMISALAKAGRVFQEPGITLMARCAMDAVVQRMWQDGTLAGSMRQGIVGGMGVQEDYAAVSLALLDLYQSDYREQDLELALTIFRAMEQEFLVEGGGYRMGNQGSGLIHNPVEAQDSAMAGGNSLAGHVLLKLKHLTFLPEMGEKLEQHFRRFGPVLNEYPEAMPSLADAFGQDLAPRKELILTGPKKAELMAMAERFTGCGPAATLVILAGDAEGFPGNEFLASLPTGQIQLYRCTGQSCGLPLTDQREILSALNCNEKEGPVKNH